MKFFGEVQHVTSKTSDLAQVTLGLGLTLCVVRYMQWLA